MKPWVKVFLVTALFAVLAMALGPVLWPPPKAVPSPPLLRYRSSSYSRPSRPSPSDLGSRSFSSGSPRFYDWLEARRRRRR